MRGVARCAQHVRWLLRKDRFERMAAERVGKESALFVVSGTMGNLVCTLTHCARGEEVILGDKSHMFLNEAGGMSALGGIHPHTVTNQPTIRLAVGCICIFSHKEIN